MSEDMTNLARISLTTSQKFNVTQKNHNIPKGHDWRNYSGDYNVQSTIDCFVNSLQSAINNQFPHLADRVESITGKQGNGGNALYVDIEVKVKLKPEARAIPYKDIKPNQPET